jgi:hypothetical protein
MPAVLYVKEFNTNDSEAVREEMEHQWQRYCAWRNVKLMAAVLCVKNVTLMPVVLYVKEYNTNDSDAVRGEMEHQWQRYCACRNVKPMAAVLCVKECNTNGRGTVREGMKH